MVKKHVPCWEVILAEAERASPLWVSGLSVARELVGHLEVLRRLVIEQIFDNLWSVSIPNGTFGGQTKRMMDDLASMTNGVSLNARPLTTEVTLTDIYEEVLVWQSQSDEGASAWRLVPRRNLGDDFIMIAAAPLIAGSKVIVLAGDLYGLSGTVEGEPSEFSQSAHLSVVRIDGDMSAALPKILTGRTVLKDEYLAVIVPKPEGDLDEWEQRYTPLVEGERVVMTTADTGLRIVEATFVGVRNKRPVVVNDSGDFIVVQDDLKLVRATL